MLIVQKKKCRPHVVVVRQYEAIKSGKVEMLWQGAHG